MPAKALVSRPLPPALVKTKVEGTKVIHSFQADVEGLTVTTEEELETADVLLGDIRRARKQWAAKMDPILAPLKQAKLAAEELNREIDRPLGTMELAIKGMIREYRIAEDRRLQLETQAQEKAQAEIDRKLAETATRELSARTAQMRDRLAKQREKLEERAEEVAAEAPVAAVATHSQVRRVKKWRVVDKGAAIAALNPGMSHLIIFDSAAIHKLTTQPGGWDKVASWGGFEVYEDIDIAGRG